MKLVQNWRRIAARAHSMWAFYLSVLALIAPELIYAVAGIDTNPRLWWFLALVLLIYGIVGRLKDQGIDRDTTRSPWPVGLVVLAIASSLALTDWRGAQAFSQPGHYEPPAGTSSAGPMPAPESVFVKHAVPFIGRWEGLRLTAYRDIVGVWTVCYGETRGVRPGDTYTKAQCDAMLAREVLTYRGQLHRYFSAETLDARLPVLRDVAFTSLAYNAGAAAIGSSTAVRRLNAGDVAGACQAVTWWSKAGGRVIRGLVARRTEERELCLRGAA